MCHHHLLLPVLSAVGSMHLCGVINLEGHHLCGAISAPTLRCRVTPKYTGVTHSGKHHGRKNNYFHSFLVIPSACHRKSGKRRPRFFLILKANCVFLRAFHFSTCLTFCRAKFSLNKPPPANTLRSFCWRFTNSK